LTFVAAALIPERVLPLAAGNFSVGEQTAKAHDSRMDEGRKRVIGIIAGILVARHLKNTDDLFDSKGSPRTEAMVAAAVQWAERILRKVDNACGGTRS
jgi:hypothetical protein